jgi:hypothetical protein
MTDAQLMGLFREISSHKQITHTTKLSSLKKKIETDIFVNDAVGDRLSKLHTDDKNLQFVNTCIDKLQDDKLTKKDMKKLNLLNRKYKRKTDGSE